MLIHIQIRQLEVWRGVWERERKAIKQTTRKMNHK